MRWPLFFSLLFFASPLAATPLPRIKGSLKSINSLQRSNGQYPYLSAERMRLEGDWQTGSFLRAQLTYDQEMLYGTLVKTSKNLTGLNLPQNELWNAEWNFADSDNLIERSHIHRGTLEFKKDPLSLQLGRQRISWGEGRIWNPTDVINPYNPISIENDERAGADGAKLLYQLGTLTFVEVVYIPKRQAEWKNSLALARLHCNWRQTDWEMTGGTIGKESFAGMSQAAQVWEGSLRSEWSYVADSNFRPNFAKAVVSYDYQFTNSLYLLGELFYNGLGQRSSTNYPAVTLKATDQPFYGQRYAGISTAYDLTPLFKLYGTGIFNLDDGSKFLVPKIVYSILTNWEAVLGYQTFIGNSDSEFGSRTEIGFFQLQYFFTAAQFNLCNRSNPKAP